MPEKSHAQQDHHARHGDEASPRPEVVTPALASFLGTVMPVIVGTVRKDGTAQLNPAWYEYRDGLVWLNAAESRAWGKRSRPGAHMTLLFIDPKDMFHWAQVQGRVVDRTREGGEEHIDRLSRRYLGADYGQHDPRNPRLVITVRPTRVTGFREQG